MDGGGFFAWHSSDRTLAPGQSVLLAVNGAPEGSPQTWTAMPGQHVVTATVDDINRFAEAIENNNARTQAFWVYARGYAVNSGGPAVTRFTADADFYGSTNTFSVTNTIDLSGASNAAPEAVYRTERWGPFSYNLNNLVPNRAYIVRLHFAEVSPSVTAAGQRRFHVSINGTQVLSNFDIFAAAGGKFRAITREFQTTAPGGVITIDFARGTPQANEPKCSGIEIVAPPQGAFVSVLGSQAILRWTVTPGRTFRTQFKTNLNDAAWTTLGSDAVAPIDVFAVTNGIAGSQRRFYRLVQLD